MAASYNESLAASWELPPATFVILSCHQHCLHSTRLSFLPPPSLPPSHHCTPRTKETFLPSVYLLPPTCPYLPNLTTSVPTCIPYLPSSTFTNHPPLPCHYRLMSYNNTFCQPATNFGRWALVWLVGSSQK